MLFADFSGNFCPISKKLAGITDYSQIHIKFINQGERFSRIPLSILNQFSWHFAHTIL